jgi:hypothetical protein
LRAAAIGSAGNAVEHLVRVQLAARNRPDFAISVILNSCALRVIAASSWLGA